MKGRYYEIYFSYFICDAPRTYVYQMGHAESRDLILKFDGIANITPTNVKRKLHTWLVFQ
jgi:hypothetical protein